MCGLKFGQLVSFKTHIKIVHEKRKDYKCKTCGKEFGLSGTLNNHIKTVHEGQKDHKCEICGKEFGNSSNLIRHFEIAHEGEKTMYAIFAERSPPTQEISKDMLKLSTAANKKTTTMILFIYLIDRIPHLRSCVSQN